MRVVCTRILNDVTGDEEATSPWIDLDGEYEVLEIYCSPGRATKVRIASSESATPALFDSSMFMTVDSSIPSSWVISIAEAGEVRVGPASWMRKGFWEDFFDRDPQAVYDYELGRARDVQGDP